MNEEEKYLFDLWGYLVIENAIPPETLLRMNAWLDEQAAETLYLSSVTVAELLFGIDALPDGRGKENLATTLDGLLGLFDGRILPFDKDAARRAKELGVLLLVKEKVAYGSSVKLAPKLAARKKAPIRAAGKQ